MSDFWEQKSPKQKVRFIMGLILTILIVVFAIANWNKADINFIFFKLRLPITLLILFSMIFGYLISSFTEGSYKKKKIKEEESNKEIGD